ncbi:fimbrial protein, partial [Piscinibacter sp.]|uniref:fimbrial protein n=1 Tax=Piscinibacter sp. TaxID=1903157 RepID=UPI002B937093
GNPIPNKFLEFVASGSVCDNPLCGTAVSPATFDGISYTFEFALVKFGTPTAESVSNIPTGSQNGAPALGFSAKREGDILDGGILVLPNFDGVVITAEDPKKCTLDVGVAGILVDFGEVGASGRKVGDAVGRDMQFVVNFKDCMGGPLLRLKFDRYPEDTSIGDDYMLRTDMGGGVKLETGLVYRLFDGTPHVGNAVQITPGAYLPDILIPDGQTNYAWPFRVRLYKKSDPVRPGPFAGRSMLTVEYH